MMEYVKKVLLFRRPLAFTAKGVRKCSITKQKSICKANLRWIFARYWNGVNSNGLASCKRFNIVYEEERKTFGKDENR